MRHYSKRTNDLITLVSLSTILDAVKSSDTNSGPQMYLLEQFSQMRQLTVRFSRILSLLIRIELSMLVLYRTDCRTAVPVAF